jgi:hypothetical protein
MFPPLRSQLKYEINMLSPGCYREPGNPTVLSACPEAGHVKKGIFARL